MNRRYLVDTTTREYLCVAIQKGQAWEPTNQESLSGFMDTRKKKDLSSSELLTGEYNDNVFFEKWIRNSTNFLFRY